MYKIVHSYNPVKRDKNIHGAALYKSGNGLAGRKIEGEITV